jgi:hypothetical protein
MKMPVSPGVLPKSADVLAALKNTDLLDMNLRITCEPSPVDECVAVDEMSRAEAVSMLRERAGDIDLARAAELAGDLGGAPAAFAGIITARLTEEGAVTIGCR